MMNFEIGYSTLDILHFAHLRADVPGDRSRRKAVSQQAKLHGKIDEAIFEVIAPPGRRRSNQTYAEVVQAHATGGESTDAASLRLQMSNVQYPMTNFEIGYWTLDIGHSTFSNARSPSGLPSRCRPDRTHPSVDS